MASKGSASVSVSASKSGSGVGKGKPKTKTLGTDLGLNLPSKDPTQAVAEVVRRKKATENPGPDTRLAPDVAKAKRATFERQHEGFWLINFGNEKYSTVCSHPNIRILAFRKTYQRPRSWPGSSWTTSGWCPTSASHPPTTPS